MLITGCKGCTFKFESKVSRHRCSPIVATASWHMRAFAIASIDPHGQDFAATGLAMGYASEWKTCPLTTVAAAMPCNTIGTAQEVAAIMAGDNRRCRGVGLF